MVVIAVCSRSCGLVGCGIIDECIARQVTAAVGKCLGIEKIEKASLYGVLLIYYITANIAICIISHEGTIQGSFSGWEGNSGSADLVDCGKIGNLSATRIKCDESRVVCTIRCLAKN